MIQPQLGSAYELGFSITSPFKAVAHGVAKGVSATGHVVAKGVSVTAHGVATGAKATGHVVASGAKLVGKGLLVPLKLLEDITLKPLLKPLRNRMNTLKARRAKKLAWDRRKSTTPTVAEQNEAKSWAKSQVHGQIPFGPVMAALAGPDIYDAINLGNFIDQTEAQFGEVATAAVIAASIPVLITFLDHTINRTSKSGEAPATIQQGAQAAGRAAQDAAAAIAHPDAVDLSPAQDAAEEAASDAGGGATVSAGRGGSGGGAMVALPGGMHVKRSHLMIGGAVLGGIILLSLLTRKS